MKRAGSFATMCVLLLAVSPMATCAWKHPVQEETKSIAELYEDTITEGGKLVIYHGGDIPDQQDAVKNAFQAAFPEVNLTLIVDYSKYHDVRVDNQLETDTLVADIIAFQTLQDFPRMDREEKLMHYKPSGFSKIYDGFKDPRGAWMSHAMFTFSFFYDEAQLDGMDPPTSPLDLLDPKWKNKMASPYPHDDDAVLFIYARFVEKYGWDWVEKFAAQEIQFDRGSNTAGEHVTAKSKVIGVAGLPPISNTTVLVSGNGTDYLTWGQRIAILKKANHPAAAKLFLNWIISMETQTTVFAGISTRTDIPPTSGNKYQWEIPEAGVALFPEFMEDRANVERLKQTFALYFGEVQGKPTPGFLGLHPGL